jgi:hypothetical protein
MHARTVCVRATAHASAGGRERSGLHACGCGVEGVSVTRCRGALLHPLHAHDYIDDDDEWVSCAVRAIVRSTPPTPASRCKVRNLFCFFFFFLIGTLRRKRVAQKKNEGTRHTNYIIFQFFLFGLFW